MYDITRPMYDIRRRKLCLIAGSLSTLDQIYFGHITKDMLQKYCAKFQCFLFNYT